MPSFSQLIERHRDQLAPLFPFPLRGPGVAQLDFTAANPRFYQPAPLRTTASFARAVLAMLAEKQATTGVGGYLENRVIYRRSPLFDDDNDGEPRSLHLGLDVWVPAGTAVAAPLAGTVHSLADNHRFGDYGPTVIVRHELDGQAFFTLYGHLSRPDLFRLRPGQALAAGAVFARVGTFPENGDWPPHLHFQVITDLQGRRGDFPGVARPSEQAHWAALCPNPWLLIP